MQPVTQHIKVRIPKSDFYSLWKFTHSDILSSWICS